MIMTWNPVYCVYNIKLFSDKNYTGVKFLPLFHTWQQSVEISTLMCVPLSSQPNLAHMPHTWILGELKALLYTHVHQALLSLRKGTHSPPHIEAIRTKNHWSTAKFNYSTKISDSNWRIWDRPICETKAFSSLVNWFCFTNFILSLVENP